MRFASLARLGCAWAVGALSVAFAQVEPHTNAPASFTPADSTADRSIALLSGEPSLQDSSGGLLAPWVLTSGVSTDGVETLGATADALIDPDTLRQSLSGSDAGLGWDFGYLQFRGSPRSGLASAELAAVESEESNWLLFSAMYPASTATQQSAGSLGRVLLHATTIPDPTTLCVLAAIGIMIEARRRFC